jgi:hypothetical protein
MALFSPKQPADDGTTRPVIEALQREDAGTLAMTDEGLVDLSNETLERINQAGPGEFVELTKDEMGALHHQKLVAEEAVASTLDPTPPSYSVMVGSAWRMLEEQRAHSIDIVNECNAEIAKWTAKRDDAQRAADGCLAGQQAMGG